MNNSTTGKGEAPFTFSCGACRINRKRCSEKCVLAPYFPPDDPQKFLLVHRVFGNGHIIKLLRKLPAEQRGDAVNSMVYEASQRSRDPVNGCLGVINDLHKKVAELQSQLDSTEAQFANISVQHPNLLNLAVTNYHEALVPHLYHASVDEREGTSTNAHVFDDVLDATQLWEPHICDGSQDKSEDSHTNSDVLFDVIDPLQPWDSPLWG